MFIINVINNYLCYNYKFAFMRTILYGVALQLLECQEMIQH